MTSRVFARWTFCYVFPATLIFSVLSLIAMPFVSRETALGINAGVHAAIKPFFLLSWGGVLWFGFGLIIKTAIEKRHSRRLCEVAYRTLYMFIAKAPVERSRTRRGVALQEALKWELTRHCSKYPIEEGRQNIRWYRRYLRDLTEMSRTHNE